MSDLELVELACRRVHARLSEYDDERGQIAAALEMVADEIWKLFKEHRPT